MSVIAAAIIGSLVSAGIGAIQQDHNNKVQATATRDSKIRQYEESVRQQKARENLFNTQMGRTYGGNFVDILKNGGSTSELIDSIGKDTALGMQLNEYNINARQAVDNARRQNKQTGMLGQLQGSQDLLQGLNLAIQSEQAMGAAQASQATSGIRSDRGTGDNAAQMQEQQNDLARRQLSAQINMRNQQTVMGMGNTQLSAAQQADAFRRQRRMSATQAIESAANAYSEHIVDMQDFDESQENLLEDAKYYDDNSLRKEKMNIDVDAYHESYAEESGDVDYSDVEIKFDDDV